MATLSAGPRRNALTVIGVLAILVAISVGLGWIDGDGGTAAAADPTTVRILLGEPETLDPAAQGDIGSAAYSAQLFESLTAFDADLVLRPALASGWDLSDDGRRVVFHLRDDLTFSDGSPITATDVVESWLRIIDPAAPSPLSSLMLDVQGAEDRLAGRTTDPASVGLTVDGDDIVVDLVRPGGDFPAIVSSPTFGVVPPAIWRDGRTVEPDGFVGSGAYVLARVGPESITLEANDRFWAGRPAIRTVIAVTDIGGRSPVAAFEDGDLDHTGISASDATWIAYDATLGPQLRTVPSLSLSYMGFTTDRPPFDDVRVRRAFGHAVDWRRIAVLGTGGSSQPATSMVPPGIPGRSDRDWRPVHDPVLARSLLAEAGYPGGRGFPDVTYAVAAGFSPAFAAEIERELGITVGLETIDGHFDRLHTDPPAIWSLGWVADYPGQNDFLGVLLQTGSSNDYGRWSSPEFDAAIAAALASRDPVAVAAGFDAALAIVQRDVPVVPLAYGSGWALSREGLLGAGQNGLGIIRFAGLAWADG